MKEKLKSRPIIKRLFVTILVLTVVTMSGCTKTTDEKYGLNPEKPIIISLWHYYNGAQKTAFDNIVNKFNATVGKEKGIMVESLSRGGVNDLALEIVSSANKEVGSKPLPNVFGTYADTAFELDEKGLLVSIDEYMTQEEIGKYISGYVEEGRFGTDMGMKIFPVAKSTEVLILNKTEWDAFANVSGYTKENLSTWEGLAEVAGAYYNYTDNLTPKEADGRAFFGRDAMANYMIVGSMQLGQEMFNMDSGELEVTIDKAILKKLWDNFYIPYIKGYYYCEGRFASDDAKTGSIVALVCSSSGAKYFPKEVSIGEETPYPIESMALPVPNFEGKKPYAVQQGAGMAVVKSDPTHEYGATIFLKWFTEVEQNIGFSIDSGYLPVMKEANDIEVIGEVAKKEKIEINAELKDVLSTSISQCIGSELYTNKPFINGLEVRGILEASMIDKAKAARSEILKIEDLSARNEKVEEYSSEDIFEAWYYELNDSIRNKLEEK